MSKFAIELPSEIMRDIKKIHDNADEIFGAMTNAGAEVVKGHILTNMRRSFSDSEKLAPYLRVTKAYKTYGGKFVNTKVAFYGYYKQGQKVHVVRRGATDPKTYKSGKGYRITKTSSGRAEAEYKYDGIPVPLIALAREYGTSSGEKKRPFLRKSFKGQDIEDAMLKAQYKVSGGLLTDE